MKKYIVFAGLDYYPRGGMEDYVGDYETLAEARSKAKDSIYDWWQIVDRDLWEVIE